MYVVVGDDIELRGLRICGLAFEGRCHWEMNQHAPALAVWERAMDYVESGDEGDLGALAASCMALASLSGLETAADDRESLEASREYARRAVELAPDVSVSHQLLAQISAHSGDWQESIAAARRAVTTLGEEEETTRMLDTLMRVARAGYVGEVRDLMAGTRLSTDLEPLWHALQAELGEAVEPLPAEIKEAVTEVRRQLTPQ